MASQLAISPWIHDDPLVLGPDVRSTDAVLSALRTRGADFGGTDPGAAAVADLVPGVVLIHVVGLPRTPLALHWVSLPHQPRLTPGGTPAGVAIVLSAPLSESTRALRIYSRLRAGLQDPELLGAVRRAVSREELVRTLHPLEVRAVEASLDTREVMTLLRSPEAGLTASEAARRLAEDGENRLERVHARPVLLRLTEQFTSFFALLLWVAAILSVAAGMPQLGWAILAVILVNGGFSYFQEYQADRAVEALERLLPHRIDVLRDGAERELSTTELVPGDLVRLVEGDQVPADGQLLEAEGLQVDQSTLTGESHPVVRKAFPAATSPETPRHERQELVFAGTAVVAGSGRFVVTATAMATEIGVIAGLTRSLPDEMSPLQREMKVTTRIVTALAVAFGVVIFGLGVASGRVDLAGGFILALGVIVANVPEGLLPTLTLALAIGVRRMARQHCLVRRLSAVESLGATTVICTDKTGTLTENRLTLRFLWVDGRILAAPGPGESGAGTPELLEAGALASASGPGRADPLDAALLAAAGAAGREPRDRDERRPIAASYPFDSFRKRATFVRRDGARLVVYLKGAPREVLTRCTTIRKGGAAVTLDAEARLALLRDHDRLAGEGLRLLAVAVRELPAGLAPASAELVECDLCLIGLLAFGDPPRPGVADAVALCRRAGIRVIMITGDDGMTARAIAGQVGLATGRVVTGEELERMRTESLTRLVGEPGILFARTSPLHKLRIVRELRGRGEVVAVTGDGVNDAPALKAADIGVAMGGRGSEVARESAEMVLLDDNFASIPAAVLQGRSIYANIGKFITYIFASNVPELVPFLAAAFLGIPLPLTVMQILAVDLGTDLLPALALGAERPEPGLMDLPPRRRSERLLNPGRLWRAYAFLGLAEAVLALGAFFWTYWCAGWRPGEEMAGSGVLYQRATTMTLAAIVAAQIGNAFACRTERQSVFRAGLFTNRLLLYGIAAEIALLASLLYVPVLRDAFGLVPPEGNEARYLLLCPIVMIGLEEARKWVVRRRSRPAAQPLAGAAADATRS